MQKFIFCVVLVWGAISFGETSFDAKKHAKIERLIALSGSAKQFDLVMEKMYVQYRMMMPEVPAEMWTIMQEELNGKAMNELLRSMIPVYANHYTDADIEAMIDFYESEAGRRMVAKMPAMAEDIAVISAKWGQQFSMRVMERIKLFEQEQKKAAEAKEVPATP
jgi:hypothetical protein